VQARPPQHNCPIYKHRPRLNPSLSIKAKLAVAQATSDKRRDAPEITLPVPPWEKSSD
jgi:hypothetical protein